MKNFSKLLALGVALSLTFGMTAFAAESPVASDGTTQAALDAVAESITSSAGVTVTSVDVEGYDYAKEVEKGEAFTALADEIADTFSDVEKVNSVEVVAVFDVVGTAGEAITLSGVPGVTKGSAYVLCHYVTETTYELVPVEVLGNGSIKFTLGSFSMASVVKVDFTAKDTGSNDDGDDDDDDTPAVTATGAPASPKTGETLPVAGIAMMIALAGAAVCATKVRYNN